MVWKRPDVLCVLALLCGCGTVTVLDAVDGKVNAADMGSEDDAGDGEAPDGDVGPDGADLDVVGADLDTDREDLGADGADLGVDSVVEDADPDLPDTADVPAGPLRITAVYSGPMAWFPFSFWACLWGS